MTRGTDMGTDTMPRTPRQAPARPVPPGRLGAPPGRTPPPRRTEPRRTDPRGTDPRRADPRRADPPYARRPDPADAKALRRTERRRAVRDRANPDAPGREGPRSPSPRMRPFSAPRHTRPVAGSLPRGPRPRPRHPRAPFILLLVGLLGGALISLLMISTTLAQGSFRITNLQQQNTDLARQEQLLSQEVAQAESPAQIAQEAEQFGMQQNPNLKFINLRTGKIVSGKVSAADSQINVPGFTP